MGKFCFGIDVGGTTVKLGLFTAQGDLLEKWEIKTRVENGGINIIPDVAETVKAKIEEKNIDKNEIIGIGLGVPGPVKEDGTILGTANLGWGVFNVVKELSDSTGLTVKATNDANAAALGEMWKGGGQGYKNIVLVTLGTGIGGGIILNGQVLSGTNGASGEIGHIHINDEETEACGCGNIGCLEQVSSATGIVRIGKKVLKNSEKPSILRNKEISAKAVFDAVKEDDELAIQIAEIFGEYLGKAMAIIATVVDPQVYVIGGGVSKAGDIIFKFTDKYFQKHAFSANRNIKFALAKLGNDAGIYGAAKLIIG